MDFKEIDYSLIGSSVLQTKREKDVIDKSMHIFINIIEQKFEEINNDDPFIDMIGRFIK